MVILSLLFLFVAGMPLVPSKAEAQACVDMKLTSCLGSWLTNIIGIEPSCNCGPGYTAVSTAMTGECIMADLTKVYDWLINLCFVATYTTMCVGN